MKYLITDLFGVSIESTGSNPYEAIYAAYPGAKTLAIGKGVFLVTFEGRVMELTVILQA